MVSPLFLTVLESLSVISINHKRRLIRKILFDLGVWQDYYTFLETAYKL